MNPWPYVLSAYLLTVVGVLWYHVSIGRKTKVVSAQVEALRSQGKGAAR